LSYYNNIGRKIIVKHKNYLDQIVGSHIIVIIKLTLTTTEFTPARDVKIPDIYYHRLKTGITELDEFFGGADNKCGGLLRGGVYILAAGAGTGKSTFCLQLAEAFCNRKIRVAYASGEESIEQLAFTCKRLNVRHVPIAVQTDVDNLIKKMEHLDFIIIDSFQTLSVKKHMTPRKKELYCIRELCAAAKRTSCTVIALCHLTKAGVYKGSTAVLHAVDACINLRVDEEDSSMRVFSWSKNRFGPADKEMNVLIDQSGYNWAEEPSTEPLHTTEVLAKKFNFVGQETDSKNLENNS